MSKKILIIDDEGPDRKGMAVALGKAGYNEIFVADTGDAGIDMAKSFEPDIIFIDVVLREMNGFDICEKIKAIEGFNPKIIMITGHLDAINAQKARTSQADEIIEKTAGFMDIHKTIEDLGKT